MDLNLNDEVLVLFIEEAREHLEGIEADLLDLEAMGGDVESGHVNKIFRAIHSIKGGAGFWALENIKQLAHEMESILNDIRNGAMSPENAVISVLLDGADMLSTMINDIAGSDAYDITALLASLREISGGVGEQAAVPVEEVIEPDESGFLEIRSSAGDLVFSLDTEALQPYHRSGKFLYFAECDLLRDEEGKDAPLSSLMDEVCRTGEIVESYTDVEAVGELDPHRGGVSMPFYMIFASIVDPDLIDSVIQIEPDRILVITDKGRLTALDGGPVRQMKAMMPDIPASHGSDDAAQVPESTEQNPIPQKSASGAQMKSSSSTLRVNVGILDQLLNMAGELVLSRNQMKQALAGGDIENLQRIHHQIDRITSELQEKIMMTRMQPIDSVFSKFQRVVRDLSASLGKEVELVLEGRDVELDKGIIEAIGDPMTHLVRNALDHGIETPAERTRAGKPVPAVLVLKAYHEAGQVYIEIRDDGKGIDPAVIRKKVLEKGLAVESELKGLSDGDVIQYIFAPGFSTAAAVTEVSGRGVGMDVVRSNLNNIGGVVDIFSKPGQGTTIRIKLPLTLAIISSLIVDHGGQRYAVPQVNLVELHRLKAGSPEHILEKVSANYIMRLRDRLLPVLPLTRVLGGEYSPDPDADVLIMIISAGDLHYGLIVDDFVDTEEIVVKPLGRHAKKSGLYAGSTILGDGRAALILDVVSISREMKLELPAPRQAEDTASDMLGENAQSLIIVRNSVFEYFAIPLGLVTRVERIHRDELESPAGQQSIKYRGGSLLVFSIEKVAKVSPREDTEHPFVVVFPYNGREVGILVSGIVDAVDVSEDIDEETFFMPGILGSAIIQGRTTMLLDVFDIVNRSNPDLAEKFRGSMKKAGKSKRKTILVVEDSPFFRKNMAAIVSECGFEPVTAEDGLQGLEKLEEFRDTIGMVLTDIEMPNMDGLEMTRRIRAGGDRDLPIVACTSLAGEMAEKRGFEAGIDEYMIKLDREKLGQAVRKAMGIE